MDRTENWPRGCAFKNTANHKAAPRPHAAERHTLIGRTLRGCSLIGSRGCQSMFGPPLSGNRIIALT
ncbi:hypothetical protein QQF64_006531 [Cirrhinus molitorella]|uniref:Uncharacterized protein n=1 Tax=Cirrhinus molitorella TaxID=172907 RepID=A0ABR3MAH0_9TELE